MQEFEPTQDHPPGERRSPHRFGTPASARCESRRRPPQVAAHQDRRRLAVRPGHQPPPVQGCAARLQVGCQLVLSRYGRN